MNEHFLLRVNDCMLHERSVNDLVDDMHMFLKFCSEHNWKLNPKTCKLFTISLKWCLRVINCNGICHPQKF